MVHSRTGRGACDRYLSDPKASPEPKPDTYLAEPYWTPIQATCGLSNDNCGIHQNSTVVSHWFYLLAHGQGVDDANDNGCSVEVVPLSSDPAESLKMAGRVVFSAFALLETNAGFSRAREETSYVADTLWSLSGALRRAGVARGRCWGRTEADVDQTSRWRNRSRGMEH